jgi:hypothetical protein
MKMTIRSVKWLKIITILSALFVASCGGRNSGNANGDTGAGGDADPSTCTDGSQCRSGICQGGLCVGAVECSKHSDCTSGQYCHFPSTPNPWTPDGTPDADGSCSGACTNDPSCGIVGQSCIRGRCYTNIDCNPPDNSKDCPPGEVCNQQSRTCTVPPSQCYFNEQCPYGWQCSADHTCIDPDLLAQCTTATQCDNTPGCAVGACECFQGNCRIIGACNPANEYKTPVCGAGKYCASNRCQTATACPGTAQDSTGQSTCTPYGLVCKAGFCVNPPPCDGTAPTYNCTAYGTTWQCHTNTTPPTCSPGAECVRHDQCPAGSYCDPGQSKCLAGCRDNADCQATCPSGTAVMCATPPECKTATNCDYCGNDRKCSSTPSASSQCVSNADCPGGTVCVADDPAQALPCAMGVGTGCSLSCRTVCDTVINLVMNTCPAGQQCGSGDIMSDLMGQLMPLLLGTGASATSAVCYPPPATP